MTRNNSRTIRSVFMTLVAFGLTGCEKEPSETKPPAAEAPLAQQQMRTEAPESKEAPHSAPAVEQTPPKTQDARPYSPYVRPSYPIEVYWGETHLHSANSTDAVGAGNRLGPEETMRFARGEEVISSSGQPARLGRPLDFVVLTDHAEGLGIGVELLRGNPTLMADAGAKRWHDMMIEGGEKARQVGVEIPEALASGTLPEVLQDPEVLVPIAKTVWADNNAIAGGSTNPGDSPR